MTTPSTASEQDQKSVRVAARALARAGFVHAYGHCSKRLDQDHFLVCTSRPMGLIKPGEPGTIVPINGELPEGVLGEVRIHQQIYKRRPNIHSVCRTMPPNTMALAALGQTPKMRHGFGSYFHQGFDLWDDPQLLRNDQQASKLADQMGEAKAILMRGNGLVVAGETLEQAVCLTWYAEDAARLELEALRTGLVSAAPQISLDEAKLRATSNGGIFERMWDFLTHGDIEA